MLFKRNLPTVDAESLMNTYYPRPKECISSLLVQGITILGGAPKIGKSWLVLDLAVHIANGAPMWDMNTNQGTVLYLALEDTYPRLQERLGHITDEPPDNLYLATAVGKLEGSMWEQIENFLSDHPDTALIIIDTFQIIRNGATDISYANDYQEVRDMKSFADKHGISILLVHHLRKQGDSDPLNKLSGSTGISGAADAVWILDKEKRTADAATLVCTGRDIPSRELELRFNKENCIWELLSDSEDEPEKVMPEEMIALAAYMQEYIFFSGSNAELAQALQPFVSKPINVRSLKQLMNTWRYPLADRGVTFQNKRSNGQRLVEITYHRDVRDIRDVLTGGAENIVTNGTDRPCRGEERAVDPISSYLGGQAERPAVLSGQFGRIIGQQPEPTL